MPKAYPEEKVGVFAMREAQNVVVEYSELDPEEACATDSGNQHFLGPHSSAFVNRIIALCTVNRIIALCAVSTQLHIVDHVIAWLEVVIKRRQ